MPTPRLIQPGPGAHHTTAIVNKGPTEGRLVVIDATDLVVGRLASNVAKRLLLGERVNIVNAEKAIITGRREDVFREFKEKKNRGTVRKGPFYPRMPHLIVKRVVRGMLPNQRGNGRAAFRRLRVDIGVPEDVKQTPITIENAKSRAIRSVTIGEIAKHLGAKF